MSYPRPSAKAGTEDFSAGYVDAAEDDTIPTGASTNARNAVLTKVEVLPNGSRRAIMGKRAGSRLLATAVLSAGKAVDLVSFRRETADPVLLACCNGAWYTYDEALTSYAAISGATGFTGEAGRMVSYRNQAWLFDGVAQKLWDGTTVRSAGFARPSSVTALTTAAGPGVTGTYAAKYTWYDATHDHDSSPSTATADVAFANQQRLHTKPGGTPPANVTHWRVWVRKSTETYYGLVGSATVATATLTEAIADDARVITILGGESDNDPLAIVPAIAGVHYGHGIAFAQDSIEMHVSTQGDIESWNPKRRFKVGAEDGESVRLAKPFGSEFLLMKPHRAYRLVGTKVPFEIEPLSGSFGCVSQEAGIEVGDWFYGWDRVRGPYRTNLSEWQPLADYRLGTSLRQVGGMLDGVRAEHDEARSLVLWALPSVTSVRRRTILAFHYGLNTWLPPMTGLEYASLCAHTNGAGTTTLCAGDYWGRTFALFTGHREGVPSGSTVRGTLTSATTSSLTDTAATFPTAGGGLAGLPVAVRAASGAWAWRRIASNTATQLNLDIVTDSGFTSAPSAGSLYLVGGIEWYWTTPFLNFKEPFRQKRLHWLFVDFKPTGQYPVDVRARFDRASAIRTSLELTANAPGGVWGLMQWGASMWGSGGVSGRKARIGRVCITAQLQFSNFEPDQPVEIARFALEGEHLPNRRVTS